jgi:hypothetical protein
MPTAVPVKGRFAYEPSANVYRSDAKPPVGFVNARAVQLKQQRVIK